MPTRTIYLSDGDLAVWEEAMALGKRSNMSVSKVAVASLRTMLMERRGDVPVPLGFRVPASMKDPKALAREQLANDIRAQVLAMLEKQAEQS